MTDFWFPTPPGLTALPATPPITTNPDPVPPNTVAAPGGFDPLNPDLDNLFNVVLPVNVPPIYPATMEQTVALTIPAYNLLMTWESVLHLRAESVLLDFGPSTENAPVIIRIKGSGEVAIFEPLTLTPVTIELQGLGILATNPVSVIAFTTRLPAGSTITTGTAGSWIQPFTTRALLTATIAAGGLVAPMRTRIVIGATIS